MKRSLIIFYMLSSYSFLRSQITMQTNLPSTIPLNSEVTFEVKINKGNMTNFSKYQAEIPAGVTIQEVDSRSGSFAVEDNRVKIIWVIAPAEPEFGIRMKLISGNSPGKKTFVQKYFYMENDDKKEVEMQPVVVTFRDSSAAASSYTSNAEFVTLTPKAPVLLTTTVNPSEINTKNPEVLKQQVAQLKKDSRDAYLVGEREKSKAELKLAEANEAIAKAEGMSDGDEKKKALEKAASDKQKAETDLEVAGRVLTLAKSLEDNANEIETINRSINPGSYGEGAGASVAATSGGVPPNDGGSSQKDIDKLKEAFKSTDSPAAEPERKSGESKAVEAGLVYKVQVGAFSKEPVKSDFKGLGKILVTSEGGMYKVLVGSFGTKEEAMKKREQVISQGFDGFVVSYRDGIRVK